MTTGKTNGPGMFSDLTTSELQMLFAKLGSGAEVTNYGVYSEIEDVQLDVHQALADKVHAQFDERIARAEAQAGDPEAQAEAEF
jgi:hypothetical protein